MDSMTDEMKGAPVVMITYGRSQDVEDYVRALARRSGQECDWGYSAGRAFVHTTGDVKRVHAAIGSLRWMEAAMHMVSAGEDSPTLREGEEYTNKLHGPSYVVG